MQGSFPITGALRVKLVARKLETQSIVLGHPLTDDKYQALIIQILTMLYKDC